MEATQVRLRALCFCGPHSVLLVFTLTAVLPLLAWQHAAAASMPVRVKFSFLRSCALPKQKPRTFAAASHCQLRHVLNCVSVTQKDDGCRYVLCTSQTRLSPAYTEDGELLLNFFIPGPSRTHHIQDPFLSATGKPAACCTHVSAMVLCL